MLRKEFIQQFWNFQGGQLGLNSHDEIAHQKVGLFSTRRAGKNLACPAKPRDERKKKSYENVRYVPREHLGVRTQGKEPKCLVRAWDPASHRGGEMCSCHGLRKQAGQVAGCRSLAQFRLQKALSGSSAVPCSPFNSFQLLLTSKSSSFPAFRVLLAWGSGAISFTEVTTEPRGG